MSGTGLTPSTAVPAGPWRLDGRLALVTGASAGLGARFVRVLHQAGAEVLATARRADLLSSTMGGSCAERRLHHVRNPAGKPVEHPEPTYLRLARNTTTPRSQRADRVGARYHLDLTEGSSHVR